MESLKLNFFYELDTNIESNLSGVFKNDSEKIYDLLLKKGIYKKDENRDVFSLEYVGIIAYKETVISVLPKFLKRYNLKEKDKCQALVSAVNVIKKYTKDNETFIGTEESEINGGSLFSLIDYFFKDYIKNGIYENYVDKKEYNGEGEINWEETLECETSYYTDDRPIYLNFWTEETKNDDKNFIKKIHKYILDNAAKYLKESEINNVLNLIDIPSFDFYVNENLGEKDYLIGKIDRELKVQFNESKIILLKKMKRYINKIYSDADNGLELWGINKFWSVWEKICKDVLGDQKELYKHIPEPKWINNKGVENKIKHTLKPDVLREEEDIFYIFDAKYYDFYFKDNGELIGNPPGVPSITKQYAYELVFKKYLEKNEREKGKQKNIQNYFVIPSGGASKIIGKVEFDIFGLKPIEVLSLNYQKIFKMYLENKVYSNSELVDKLDV